MSMLEVYRETIWWRLFIVRLGVIEIPAFAVISVAFAAEPPDDPFTAPILIVALAALGLVIFSFARFTVVMTNSGIAVGFSLSKRRFRWDEVAACSVDNVSALRYGGYGIKGGVYNGKRRLVYNITGAKQVVLKVRGRRYDEFVFSTRSPEKVMRIVRMHTGQSPRPVRFRSLSHQS